MGTLGLGLAALLAAVPAAGEDFVFVTGPRRQESASTTRTAAAAGVT